MADRLSKVAAFILGPSAKLEDDDFETEFADEMDADEELTDIVDLDSVAPAVRERPQSGHQASVTPIDQRRRHTRSLSIAQIAHERPQSFAEAAKIGETFKEGIPIILNMSTTDQKQAQKLIDFASGMAFVTDGRLERITPKVFILIPASVFFSETDKESLSEIHGFGE
ncbi:MAG: cell division protein SepF [Propionibacteriaceae bacterium]|jgi:cell division inhibitor SepF|nr:cell division protein SepF [Propionibacteriaceae bacterium]